MNGSAIGKSGLRAHFYTEITPSSLINIYTVTRIEYQQLTAPKIHLLKEAYSKFLVAEKLVGKLSKAVR